MVAYSFKSRFVAPIQVGLGLQPHIPGTEYVPKRQTIRAWGKRRHAKEGDELQLYRGMRTRQCFLIGKARCVGQKRITLWISADDMIIQVDGKLLGPRQAATFARQDGFSSIRDMVEFWWEEHGAPQKWEGVLIRWEPLS